MYKIVFEFCFKQSFLCQEKISLLFFNAEEKLLAVILRILVWFLFFFFMVHYMLFNAKAIFIKY